MRRGSPAALGGIRRSGHGLDHSTDAEQIVVEPYVSVPTREPFDQQEPVSCGIPGHDHPGPEIVTDVMAVEHQDFSREVYGRCGFSTDFAYSSGPCGRD